MATSTNPSAQPATDWDMSFGWSSSNFCKGAEEEEQQNPLRAEGQHLLERVRSSAEAQVFASPMGVVSLADLLSGERIGTALSNIKSAHDQMCKLKEAIASSEVVALHGSRVINSLHFEALCGDNSFWVGEVEGQSSPGQAIGADEFNPNSFMQSWGLRAYAGWWPTYDFGFASYSGVSAVRSKRNLYLRAAKLFEDPSKELAKHMESDGSISAYDFFRLEPTFNELFFGKVSHFLRGARLYARDIFDVDEELFMMRLLSHAERICWVAEVLVTQISPSGQPVPLEEILERDEIRHLVGHIPGSSTDGKSTVVSSLVEALGESKLLDLCDDDSGDQAVVHAPERYIRDKVEATLQRDERASTLLSRDGEVPLAWLLEHPTMVRAFDRAFVRGGEEALSILRKSVQGSHIYILDPPGICVRCGSHTWQELPTTRGRASSAGRTLGTVSGGVGKESWRPTESLIPKAKDVKLLRALLAFYFDPFSIQHNRLTLTLVGAQRKAFRGSGELRQGYLRSGGFRPTFSVADLKLLPRLKDRFDKYSPEAASYLLATAVVGGSKSFPLRICARRELDRPRGSWSMRDPRLELTYFPNLRFIEVSRPCKATDLMLSAQSECEPSRHELFDPNTFLVASYSVSSELSHEQSPKATLLLDDILAGTLEPGATSWEHRQSRIKRQLLMFNPDIICIQGIQSAGFANRCSEVDPIWFNTDGEPMTNHLVHLYRQMSKENYGVVFAPTLMQPDSDITCFGNAIFWKRSRWVLGKSVGLQRGSAICAELVSKVGSAQLLVCCSKPAASYAKEWGGDVTHAEVASSICDVQALFTEVACSRYAGDGVKRRMLWCGDFACELGALLPELQERAEIVADEAEDAAEIACNAAAKASAAAKIAAASAACDPTGAAQKLLAVVAEESTAADAKAFAAVKAAEWAVAATKSSWRSACATILGEDTCTSASPHTSGQAVDLILHDQDLEALAVLGGMPSPIDFNEMIRDGLPSDHLMQLALFTDVEANNPSLTSSVAFPRLGDGSHELCRRPRMGPAPARPPLRNRNRVASRQQPSQIEFSMFQ